MKLKIFLILSALMILAPVTVYSQAPLSLEKLQVALWPEYDRTAMLVIYRIYLPPDAQLPAELSFRIPSAAGEPNAVAALTDAGLVNMKYKISQEGDWSVIKFSSNTLAAQIEYYDPGLVIEGNQRSFTYTWPGDYAVKNLQVEVQQPANASGMTLTPKLSQKQENQDGLTYYSQDFGGFPAGKSFSFSVDYDNLSGKLTSPQTIPTQTVESASPVSNYWRWFLLMAAVVIFYRVWRAKPFQGSSQHNQQQASQTGHFCHQCGKKALAGDKFCRNCGTKLRR